MIILCTQPVTSGGIQMSTLLWASILLQTQLTPISKYCVPVIKGAGLSQNEKDFNWCIAHVHACNEHAIGMLKGRWASLKHLPITIRKGAARKERDLTKALDWIQLCIILHNFLIEENDVAELSDNWCLQHVSNQVPGNPQHDFNAEEYHS
ncbi:hypothetical protein BGZ74_006085, partial [Mortierella antarctica]